MLLLSLILDQLPLCLLKLGTYFHAFQEALLHQLCAPHLNSAYNRKRFIPSVLIVTTLWQGLHVLYWRKVVGCFGRRDDGVANLLFQLFAGITSYLAAFLGDSGTLAKALRVLGLTYLRD